ncbi:MAG: site-specific integrase [Pelomonas sp.]|nr:site-specific integrase [Roseateles sp.]
MFVSVKLRVLLDSSGSSVDVPGLLTPGGLFSPLLDYFLDRQLARSLSWMDKVSRSVRLFLEYMQANAREEGRTMFANFAKRLYSGTLDETTGVDTSGLYWRPRRSADASGIITDLTLFLDWVGQNSRVAAGLNPLVPASGVERRWNEAARCYRRERALLGHLWSAKDDERAQTRRVRPKPSPATRPSEPPAFPEHRFADLISHGFRVGDRIDHRGICITLLLHGAGFRASEPFHLYVEDVVPDPKDPTSALVRIHHPSDSPAPVSWTDALKRPKRGTRAVYLLERYGLKPRDKLTTSAKAGWKGGWCDAPYFMEARWFEPAYGRRFMEHWLQYLQQLAQVERNHPFAFANLGREPRGEMYKLGQFNDAHADACRRIGLTVSKAAGTTPHGHRHSYGRRLKRAKVDEFFIQMFLHHCSPDSQIPYTQPNSEEISEALREGAARLVLKSPES